MLAAIARRDRIPVLMCNQVGGNDSLIFDGSSLAINAPGELIAQAASFRRRPGDPRSLSMPRWIRRCPEDDDTEAAYQSSGPRHPRLRSQMRLHKVLIALSGGIDSALVAAIAKDALGAENVLAIGMPSPYSSSRLHRRQPKLAANLGIRFELIGISGLFKEYTQALKPLCGHQARHTEENIQSRIRGTLMMALSNKFSALVLTTGNKSEMAVGYCTLYGDMVGALAVIGDLVKTRVYAVCHWLNRDTR
jgi:NAD+ synthase (glutamine-hydrolysing)